MEFKEAMRIWKRMCAAHNTCLLCPIVGANGGECRAQVTGNPQKYEAILAKWAEEHPEKTIADDFFEKHPKAMKGMDGMPISCARKIGYVSFCPCAEKAELDCAECWRIPLEEARHD